VDQIKALQQKEMTNTSQNIDETLPIHREFRNTEKFFVYLSRLQVIHSISKHKTSTNEMCSEDAQLR